MQKVTIAILLLTLLKGTLGGHVDIINCADSQNCLDNVDLETISVIKEHMYNSTDPCVDFWDYACGSWSAQPYYDHADTLEALTNNYAQQILEVLKGEESPLVAEKIWQYYESCRSAGIYFLDVSKYLQEIPAETLFGKGFQWSMMSDANSSFWISYNWLLSISELRKYGFSGVLMEESAGFASNDSRRYVIEVKIPPPKRNFENKMQIFEVIEEFQIKVDEQILLQLIDDLYKFDEEMADLRKKYESSAENSKIFNLEELIDQKASLNWGFYFTNLAGKAEFKFPVEIYGDPDYFSELDAKLSGKDKLLVAWYLLLNFCNFLGGIRPVINDTGCVLHTSVMFPLAVNSLYNRLVHKTRKEDEHILGEILHNLKQHLLSYIEANKFKLHEQELHYLKDKIAAVHLQIGNLPQKLPDLQDYYSSANIVDNNFHANHLEMLKFRFQQQHQPLWQKIIPVVDPESYYINDDVSVIRNAPYFVHSLNRLVVPELFLQLPFYHHQQNALLHYSLVGWIMAHELSHCLDVQGLRYDSQGNLNPLGYQISVNPLLLKGMECLSCHSPPTATPNERFADVNGLQLAWDVYWTKVYNAANLPEDSDLPQLFLLNFAQFFCGSLPQAIHHDRDDVRVRVSVRNLREFSQVFQCGSAVADSICVSCDVWRS